MPDMTNLDRFLHGDPTERFSLWELREIFGQVQDQKWPVTVILDRMKAPAEVRYDA